MVDLAVDRLQEVEAFKTETIVLAAVADSAEVEAVVASTEVGQCVPDLAGTTAVEIANVLIKRSYATHCENNSLTPFFTLNN